MTNLSGLSEFDVKTYGFKPSGLSGFFFGSLASATLNVMEMLDVRLEEDYHYRCEEKMNEALIWKSGALLAATGISFGAFGAHGALFIGVYNRTTN